MADRNKAEREKRYRKELLAKDPDALNRLNRASFKRRLEQQAGRPRPDVCDICSNSNDDDAPMVFDHDHETGKFRGWVCSKCNWALGLLRDNIEIALNIALYLERSRRG